MSERPQDIVEHALSAARCDGCVVIADETSTANLRWAGNTLTTNGVARSRRLTVIAIDRRSDGAATGVVSRSGIRDDQVEDVVRAAEKEAAEGSPAEDADGLIGADTTAPFGMAAPGQPSWDDPAVSTGIGVLQGFSAQLGDTLRAAGSAGRKLYGYAEHELTSTFLGSSTGLRLRHDQPSGKVELNAKSADLSRSAWAGEATRDFADVDVAALDAGLAERLEWARRRIDLPAGRYETLLPPTATSDLLTYLYWSAGAKDAIDGRTVFSKPGGGTRVGERLTSQPVTLRSDPATRGLACAPFVIAHASSRDSSVFDNGLPLGPTDWIRRGELAALTQTRYSARLSGLPVTPAIDNLVFETDQPDPPGLADMIARTERGLLLTCLWYIREVDPQTLLLTGLTRDGVYLVENGEVTGAVNNFRFNESPVGMLGRLAEVGASVPTLPREWGDYFSRVAMPPVRIEGFNMSSVSQAS
ncbi:MAG TPA: metallopeptidase TldD-related protein [Streptosporangiaceae bacterium]|jgi:predicted Zn-dependent protease|nr:metallopeptidase TldD-related protein [Streptosporangiaceae bacterium]